MFLNPAETNSFVFALLLQKNSETSRDLLHNPAVLTLQLLTCTTPIKNICFKKQTDCVEVIQWFTRSLKQPLVKPWNHKKRGFHWNATASKDLSVDRTTNQWGEYFSTQHLYKLMAEMLHSSSIWCDSTAEHRLHQQVNISWYVRSAAASLLFTSFSEDAEVNLFIQERKNQDIVLLQCCCFRVSSGSDTIFLSWRSCWRTTSKCQPDLSQTTANTLRCMCCTHTRTHTRVRDIYLLFGKQSNRSTRGLKDTECGWIWGTRIHWRWRSSVLTRLTAFTRSSPSEWKAIKKRAGRSCRGSASPQGPRVYLDFRPQAIFKKTSSQNTIHVWTFTLCVSPVVLLPEESSWCFFKD